MNRIEQEQRHIGDARSLASDAFSSGQWREVCRDIAVEVGEHISRVVWGLLEKQTAGGRLECVTIVESPEAAFDYVGAPAR